MSNLTSTLTIALNDDGLAAKARADAEALKRLGATEADLKKLGKGGAQALAKLHDLGGKGAKLDAFRAGARNLKEIGAGMRQARAAAGLTAVELDRVRAAAAKATPGRLSTKEIRAAEKAHKGAMKRADQAAEAWREQASAHRSLRRELLADGVALGARGANGGRGLAIGKAEAQHKADVEATSRALREQVGLLRSREAAERQHAAQAPARATAARLALRGAVDAGRDARASRAAATRATLKGAVDAGLDARASRATVQREHVQKRASASRDMADGMGRAGASELEAVEARNADDRARRRMAEGMGRPSREKAAEALAEAEASKQTRIDARKAIAGGTLLYGGQLADDKRREVLDTYQEVDDLIRYQGAVSDLNQDERNSRMAQALHLGATTRFNDVQVLHGQLDLAQRGVKKEFIEPFIGEVVNYAQAQNTDLGSAAKTLEGIVFSTNQNVEDPKTALKVMRRQVDLAVKMSKIGGLDNDDVAQAFKFGGASGSGAGLSNETMGAGFALLRRSGYTGSEAGVATRGLASKLVSPTQKGFGALDAMGVRWEDYTTLKRGASPQLADNAMQRAFGKKLTEKQKAQFEALFADAETFGDQGEYTAAATGIVQSSFEKSKKGKLKAQDASNIAKVFGDLRKMMIESVDSEGLLDAILAANPTLAQANAWATDKHGGKVIALARKYKEFTEYKEQLKHTPEGFAKGIGDQRNSGFAGARAKVRGSEKNVESSIAQSLDNNGEGNGGLLTQLTNAKAYALQSIAELPKPLLAVGAVASYVAGEISSLAGAAMLTGAAAGVGTAVATGKGAAVATGTAALGLPLLPLTGAVAATVPLLAADKSKGIVHGGKNIEGSQTPEDVLPGMGTETQRRADRVPSLPPGWGSRGTVRSTPGLITPNAAGAASTAGVKSLIDSKPERRVDTGPLLGQGTGAGVPGANAAAIDAATAALKRYKAELATVKSEMSAQADLGLPGLGPGLEQRKGELERLVSETQAKLTALSSTTIAPQFDASGAQAFGTTVDGVKAKAQEASALSIGIPVSAPGAGTVIQQLQQIITLAGQATAAAGRVGSGGGGTLKARSSSRSFSDGVTPGYGQE